MFSYVQMTEEKSCKELLKLKILTVGVLVIFDRFRRLVHGFCWLVRLYSIHDGALVDYS